MLKIDIQKLHVRTKGLTQQQAMRLARGLPESILSQIMANPGSFRKNSDSHIRMLNIRPIRFSHIPKAQDVHHRVAIKMNRCIVEHLDSTS